jgi:hypothetical protein
MELSRSTMTGMAQGRATHVGRHLFGNLSTTYSPALIVILEIYICDNHDFCYNTCGETQASCDIEFLETMYSKCNDSWDSENKQLCKTVAFSMFSLVDIALAKNTTTNEIIIDTILRLYIMDYWCFVVCIFAYLFSFHSIEWGSIYLVAILVLRLN